MPQREFRIFCCETSLSHLKSPLSLRMKGADVIWTILTVALISTAAATLAAALTTPAAPRRRAVRLPSRCTEPLTGDPIACTLDLVGFTGDYGRIQAVLRLTNEVTGLSAHILAGVHPVRERRHGRSAIVGMTTEPIDEFRVGAHVRTSAVRLVPSARRGTVIAHVASALGFANPRSEARALNRLLGQSMIQVAEHAVPDRSVMGDQR
jgi:hypothetical protein